jgi:hypothetical protein
MHFTGVHVSGARTAFYWQGPELGGFLSLLHISLYGKGLGMQLM